MKTGTKRRCRLAEWLTKTGFLALHQCRLRHWYAQNEPGLATPPSAGLAMRAETGQEIDLLSQSLFPGASLAPRHDDPAEASAALHAAIASGRELFLQATIAADGLTARLDVLRQVGNSWRITEVKSSTKPKDSHYLDLAFQWHVAEAAGLQISRASVVHVDTSYVRDGELEATGMLKEVDVTDEVLLARASVLETLLAGRSSTDKPEILPGRHCTDPHECPFLDHCEKQLDPDDLYFAPGLYERDRVAFRAQGITRLQDLGDDHKVAAVVSRARDTVRFDRPAVEDGLAQDLDVAFPVLFLDFEAVEPPVPLYDGTSPYQRLPFQWSAHVMDAQGAACRHFEFLWGESSDPSAAFVATLLPLVVGAATVAVYSTYERLTLKKLAEKGVPGADRLYKAFEPKEFDLLKVVRANVYHRDFRGSFSIKKVLPALAPGEGYDGLDVKDGEMAVVTYLQMLKTAPSPERDALRRGLLDYCRQDTWAMVVVYNELRALAGLVAGTTR
ncbi:MAG: DUF2779 domain-containing protein [Armatimonadetes bacterium]|nr:DUF2779 domain-containing protein [Armatimonadota bacterium]